MNTSKVSLIATGLYATVIAGGILLPAPASAAVDGIAPWLLVQTDDTCAVSVTYEGEGEMRLSVGFMKDGRVTFSVSSASWSSSEQRRYDLIAIVNGYEHQISAVGISYDDSNGLLAIVDLDFVADLSAGTNIGISRSGIPIAALNLSGSARAIQRARECVRDKQLLEVEQENAAKKKKWQNIASDPFSNDPEVVPVNNMTDWVSYDDYPLSAIKYGRSGTTKFELDINSLGEPISCKITSSSGHSDLDTKTCELMMNRGKFSRPKNGSAKFSYSFTWKLPD